MRNLKKIVYIKGVALMTIAVTLAGCGGGGEKSAQTDTYKSGMTTIFVDETLRPIIEAEINAFQAIYPQAKINAKYVSESEVFRAYTSNDSCKLIIAARKLDAAELNSVKTARNFTPRNTDFAIDGVILVVHPSNPDTNLTIGQIDSLLTGKAKTWADINSKNKIGAAQVVFDKSGSSLARFAVDSVTHGKATAANVYAAGSNPQVFEYVAKTPGALGVVGFNWLSDMEDPDVIQRRAQTRFVGVQNKQGKFVKLDKDVIYKLAMNRYPFKRMFYLIPREARNGLASGFSNYVAGKDGQLIIHKSGLVPTNSVIRLVEYKEGDLRTEPKETP